MEKLIRQQTQELANLYIEAVTRGHYKLRRVDVNLLSVEVFKYELSFHISEYGGVTFITCFDSGMFENVELTERQTDSIKRVHSELLTKNKQEEITKLENQIKKLRDEQ